MVSSAALFLCFVLFSVPFMEISFARQRAGQINEKFKAFYQRIDEYQKNHNGILPPPSVWCDELVKADPKIKKNDFQLTFYKRKICFVYNKALENVSFSSLPPKTVLIFTTYKSENNWNLTGDEPLFKSLIKNARPYDLPYVLLADGDCIGVSEGLSIMERDSRLVWEPALYKNPSEPNKIGPDK